MLRRQPKDDNITSLIVDPARKGEYYGTLSTDDHDVELSKLKSPDNPVVANTHNQDADFNFFNDGETKIDFVLVWELDHKEKEMKTEKSTEEKGTIDQHAKWRDKFLHKLSKAGIKMEKHVTQTKETEVHYMLLSAPWNVQCYYAEELSLRVPLQAMEDEHHDHWSNELLKNTGIPNIMHDDVPSKPQRFYTCQFKNSKRERFLGSDKFNGFFSNTQRHQIMYEILARIPYGRLEKAEVGIDRLLSENVFAAAFPLHDGSFESDYHISSPDNLSLRQLLYHYWARWRKWYKYQPMDHIREYFGEKIALYFAWLGFYTAWLLPAAIFGTLLFIIGVFLMIFDIPAMEICESEDNYKMCPICSICPFWNLSSICTTFKAGLLFDHGGTVFFSIFMALWAVLFLEYWKRTTATLAHNWDCSEFEEIEERPRPEFTAMAPMTIRNPITGAEEPYFPKKSQVNRILTGCMVILFMISIVLIFLISVILYRAIIGAIVFSASRGFLRASAARIASLSGSVLNLIFIMTLSKVYTSLARVLTKWEMHRTQTQYEDAFIFKVFVFQFVNFYSSPVYIAFFKGRFVGYPGNYYTLFGIRNEDCGAPGCLIELAQELLVIMVGKQLINNIQEFVIPKIKSWWQNRKIRFRKETELQEKLEPWVKDYQLLVCGGLFDEYLEMVLQFGFITIFVAACPLAPLFALLNNWIEIRLDAHKFVCEYRRPVAERAQDIGIWFHILEIISYVAVISNGFLIAFTSDFLPRLYYQYTRDNNLVGYVNFTLAYSPKTFNSSTTCRYRAQRDQDGNRTLVYWNLLAIRLGFVILFEHVVFFIARLIDLLVPDIPESVEIKVKREHYMAKQALAENQSLGHLLFEPDNGTRSSTSGEVSPSEPTNVAALPSIPENQPL
ncbi:anoctamin-7 [Protopterus annectens]|uniref:anoctamin-7 n=1 Tax=Protopterus annectens TaxID=7888 RepID=UPI001CFBB9E0|nr:anoctamin-7 [Protopterus annectens]